MKYSTLTALAGYVICLIWYGWDLWSAWTALQSSSPYPFYFNASPWSAGGFSLAGSIYWLGFGLDRSGSPSSIAGYILAGVHVFTFAVQVWLAPTLWAMGNLTN
jgi:hypothetical protein